MDHEKGKIASSKEAKLTEAGSVGQGVTKKILYAGNPSEFDSVIEKRDVPKNMKIFFHVKTTLTAKPTEVIDDSRDWKKPLELVTGMKFKLPIWETILTSMRIREVSEYQVPKRLVLDYPLVAKTFRDAEKGNKVTRSCCGMMAQSCGYHDLDHLIAAPADLTFVFEVLSWQKPEDYAQDTWQLSNEQKLESVLPLKESGNKKFKEGDVAGAKADYFLALSRLEQLSIHEQPGSPEFQMLGQVKVPILLNYGFCAMKEGNYYEAIEHISNVLELDPNNTKAFFRRGKCHKELANFDDAQADFNRAAKIDPSLRQSVSEELSSLQVARKRKDEHDRNVYTKLFI